MFGLITCCAQGAAAAEASATRGFFAAGAAGFLGWAFAMFTGDQLAYDSSAGIFWYIAALALSALGMVSEPALAKKRDVVAPRRGVRALST